MFLRFARSSRSSTRGYLSSWIWSPMCSFYSRKFATLTGGKLVKHFIESFHRRKQNLDVDLFFKRFKFLNFAKDVGDAVEFGSICLDLIGLENSIIFDVLRVLADFSHLIEQALEFLRVNRHWEIFCLWRLVSFYKLWDTWLDIFDVVIVHDWHDQEVNVRLPLKFDLFYSLGRSFD